MKFILLKVIRAYHNKYLYQQCKKYIICTWLIILRIQWLMDRGELGIENIGEQALSITYIYRFI